MPRVSEHRFAVLAQGRNGSTSTPPPCRSFAAPWGLHHCHHFLHAAAAVQHANICRTRVPSFWLTPCTLCRPVGPPPFLSGSRAAPPSCPTHRSQPVVVPDRRPDHHVHEQLQPLHQVGVRQRVADALPPRAAQQGTVVLNQGGGVALVDADVGVPAGGKASTCALAGTFRGGYPRAYGLPPHTNPRGMPREERRVWERLNSSCFTAVPLQDVGKHGSS